jgi:hypothetical protein
MLVPDPRGDLSAHVAARLRGGALGGAPQPAAADPLADDDLHLALYLIYELSYAGFEGVDPELERDPELLALRAELEDSFLGALTDAVARREVEPDGVGRLLFRIAEEDEAPSVSRFLAKRGELEHFREFAMHRSAYQLKEADPHSWAIPRLTGAPKSALLEVQYDEYGSGRPERMHSRLFADAMEALGLDSAYGAYLDRLPGVTLATVNLMTMFGLRRRWRGAIVGHLAMFEMTSPAPNRLYGNGLRRLGLEEATPFFDEHVEADSVHENIAAYDLAEGLARQQPELASDVVFGAECLLELEGRWAAVLLAAWEAGESSLLSAREPASA